jgi:hypothetical protein
MLCLVLQLQEFIEDRRQNLGSALSAAEAANATATANFDWFNRYSGDIIAWLKGSPSAASFLSFNPVMFIITVIGYLVAKY